MSPTLICFFEEHREAALFAPRRKRSACKAALRHRQYHCAPVSLLRDPEARIWGEEEEEEVPYGFPLRDLFRQLQTFLCVIYFFPLLTKGLQLVRTVPSSLARV
ncbi:hypothetical protein AMECASPLE_028441 [Ameca splendens]|uniref:Uncharacterized protein n=1 Tax=Ameca splendens TaxID=208324 RepID=A0ABV1ABU6_9TELE